MGNVSLCVAIPSPNTDRVSPGRRILSDIRRMMDQPGMVPAVRKIRINTKAKRQVHQSGVVKVALKMKILW